jgi:hypothetical protein
LRHGLEFLEDVCPFVPQQEVMTITIFEELRKSVEDEVES